MIKMFDSGYKMDEDLPEVLKEIYILFEKFMKSRGYFPYMGMNMIGERKFQTATIYRKWIDTNITFIVDKPLTREDVETNNEIGGLLNQNIIIRLCALLEEYDILKYQEEVDHTINDHEAAYLAKQLRNRYAHSLGKPDSQNRDHKALFRRLNNYLKPLNPFQIDDAEYFPNSIDTVIIPLFKGCYKYAEGILKKPPSESKSSQNQITVYDLSIAFSSGFIEVK
ncbi:MAG TPA: hypothetical protein DDY59_00765 [Lachnospiraceae bacterium]|jgi:hypothetical protein|nr:hypothetical protein [Lachnospiraceae bacterium]